MQSQSRKQRPRLRSQSPKQRSRLRSQSPKQRPLRPVLMGSSGAVMLVLPPLWPFVPAAVATYALATGAEAVRVGRKVSAAAIPMVWAMFPVLHASHGTGFAAGLVRYLRNPDWSADHDRLDARRAHLKVVP